VHLWWACTLRAAEIRSHSSFGSLRILRRHLRDALLQHIIHVSLAMLMLREIRVEPSMNKLSLSLVCTRARHYSWIVPMWGWWHPPSQRHAARSPRGTILAWFPQRGRWTQGATPSKNPAAAATADPPTPGAPRSLSDAHPPLSSPLLLLRLLPGLALVLLLPLFLLPRLLRPHLALASPSLG